MDHRKFSNVNPDAPSQRPPVPAAPPRRSLWGKPIGYVVAYGPDTYGQHLLTHEEAEAQAAHCGGAARVVLVCVAPDQAGAQAWQPAKRSEPNDDGEPSPQVIEQAECVVQHMIASSPEPLRKLGARLAALLDEDQFASLQPLLLSAAQPAQQDALDAARYRWLRHADLDEMEAAYWPGQHVPEGAAFDAAVDAAIRDGVGAPPPHGIDATRGA
jgi:hypothetical protein